MAKDQGTEFIDHSILLLRIVASQILPQPPEEFALSSLLALKTKAYESGDRSAHTRVKRLGVLFHLLRETGRQTDTISRFEFSLKLRLRLATAAISGPFRYGCF